MIRFLMASPNARKSHWWLLKLLFIDGLWPQLIDLNVSTFLRSLSCLWSCLGLDSNVSSPSELSDTFLLCPVSLVCISWKSFQQMCDSSMNCKPPTQITFSMLQNVFRTCLTTQFQCFSQENKEFNQLLEDNTLPSNVQHRLHFEVK